jgi:antitoxin (DNA-binding transcriptional repressor) of toxin-antitoxin stability system
MPPALDEVAESGETIIVTRRGKPVARLLPEPLESVGGDVSDPPDQIIFATAVASDALLVAGEQRLQELDPTPLVW